MTVGSTNNLSSTFIGSLGDGNAAGSTFIKAGSGTFVLGAGSTSSYTGPTNVNSGSFVVDGTLTASAVSVLGGILGGTGTIKQAVTASAGTTIAPGDGAGKTGSLKTGSVQMVQGGSFNVELGGTGAGQFDQLVVSSPGTLKLNNGGGGGGGGGSGAGGVTLNVSLANGFVPAIGQSFMIINNQGPFALVGKFFGPINQGGTFTLNSRFIFSVSYMGGDGNDVVITVTAVSGQATHFAISPPAGVTTVAAGTQINFSVSAWMLTISWPMATTVPSP